MVCIVAELVLPGQALPEAFQSLEKRLDSTLKLCKLTPDAQMVSVIAICQELQRLLKCAFIGKLFIWCLKLLSIFLAFRKWVSSQ